MPVNAIGGVRPTQANHNRRIRGLERTVHYASLNSILPDGIDHTDEGQALFDALAASGTGNAVYFDQPGRYLTRGWIYPPGLLIYGINQGQSELYLVNSATISGTISPAILIAKGWWESSSTLGVVPGTVIRDLKLSGNRANNPGNPNRGLILFSQQSLVTNLWVDECSGIGIHGQPIMRNGVDAGKGFAECHFIKNRVTGCGLGGIVMGDTNSNSGFTDGYLFRNTVNRIQFDYGITIWNAGGWQAIGNRTSQTPVGGYKFSGGNQYSFIGNRADEVGGSADGVAASATAEGARFSQTAGGDTTGAIVVANNHMDMAASIGASCPRYVGMHFEPASNGYPNWSIMGNDIRGNDQAAGMGFQFTSPTRSYGHCIGNGLYGFGTLLSKDASTHMVFYGNGGKGQIAGSTSASLDYRAAPDRVAAPLVFKGATATASAGKVEVTNRLLYITSGTVSIFRTTGATPIQEGMNFYAAALQGRGDVILQETNPPTVAGQLWNRGGGNLTLSDANRSILQLHVQNDGTRLIVVPMD